MNRMDGVLINERCQGGMKRRFWNRVDGGEVRGKCSDKRRDLFRRLHVPKPRLRQAHADPRGEQLIVLETR